MALQSMTAYGHGQFSNATHTYTCEIKSLNSRFTEVFVRLPRSLIAMEAELIKEIKSVIERGKVDCFIDIQSSQNTADLPELNMAAVDHYLNLGWRIQEQAKTGSRLAPLSTADVLALEGVLGSSRSPEPLQQKLQKHQEGIKACLQAAVESMQKARSDEGQALHQALLELLQELSAAREEITAKQQGIREQLSQNYVTRIEQTIKDLTEKGIVSGSDILRERLTTEVGIYADKIDIAEELTRLAAHEQEFLKLLSAPNAVGRKLDFFCQEMHREVNTISNKLVQFEVARITVSMKQTVERLKQQVQNIE